MYKDFDIFRDFTFCISIFFKLGIEKEILEERVNIVNSYVEKLEYFEFGCLEHI